MEKRKPFMNYNKAYDAFLLSSGYEDENEIQIIEYFADDLEYWKNFEG